VLAATIDLIKMSPLDINNALAYIDPGSGSAIISAIIGVFVAIGIAVKTYWYKIKRFFSRSEPSRQEDSNSQKTEEQETL